MPQPKPRAIASLSGKLVVDTPCSKLTREYKAGTEPEVIFKHVAHAVLFNKGKTAAKEFFDKFLESYEDGHRDPTTPPGAE